MSDGRDVVRLAHLRGQIAALARGGRYDLAIDLLGELARVDLALGLPADGVQRARQAAQLADETGAPSAGPLIVLGATLLAAGAPGAAIDACAAAIARADAGERPRVEAFARLVGGAAQRRAGRLAEARLLLDAARGAAARLGEAALGGLALAELGWIDLAEDRPAAAATCFEFAAEFLRRAPPAASEGPRAWIAKPPAVNVPAAASLEADALAVACWAAADAPAEAIARAAAASAAALAADRPDLAAYCDGVLAELALRRADEDAAAACARAAASADRANRRASPLGRELVAEARLRQARAATDPRDRAHHLDAGIELAFALERPRTGVQLGYLLAALVDDAARAGAEPPAAELARLARALVGLGDAQLAALADGVLAEIAGETR